MPCTYTGSLEGDRALAAEEALDAMTDRACRAFRLLEEHAMLTNMTDGDLAWWHEHKIADEEAGRL